MSNASLTDAYRILREVTGGQEPYAAVVPEMARALDRYRDQVLERAMVPFQNLLSTLSDDSNGASTAKQVAINDFHRQLSTAIKQAMLPRDAAQLGEKR
jgi:hypothetical protein